MEKFITCSKCQEKGDKDRAGAVQIHACGDSCFVPDIQALTPSLKQETPTLQMEQLTERKPIDGQEMSLGDPEVDFSEWYNEIVEEAGLTDKRYPVKGMNVWPPYGWKAMMLIDNIVRNSFDVRGHQEVYFPLLIPRNEFEKEKEHIKGFDAQVFWVTKAGENELDIPLLLRPTSETAMYPLFAIWIRSHADLPLRIYQIVNTFRYETKQTRAFIRVREIHFIEGHTCHSTFEDAERQIQEDLEIMDEIARKLCLPYRIHRRTEWDKFPGAYYTNAIDTLMPDGRTLQIASIHQYRNNFAIPYGIYFEDLDGQRKPVFQTTYGMSERMLGAVVAVHGDEKGLKFPPAIAPIQFVIVPIPLKGEQKKIERFCAGIYRRLQKAGFRVHYDARDIRPGNKFYEWEKKGVPVRLEIGKREMEEKYLTAVRRDTGKREKIPLNSLKSSLLNLFASIEQSLYESALKREKGMERFIEDISKPAEGLNLVWWCGKEECGKEIEERSGITLLGTKEKHDYGAGRCAICASETSTLAVLGRPL